MGEVAEREVDPLWMLRQSLGDRRDCLMPGCGWLPDEWLAGDALRKAVRKATRSESGNILAGYASPPGSLSLLLLLARRLAEQGVETGPVPILLNDNSKHAPDPKS